MIDRRQLLQAGAGAVSLAFAEGLVGTSGRVLAAGNSPSYEPVIGDSLPKLPYAVDSLEPHIDARTMTIHHDKHHAAYVDNLKKALASHPQLQKKSPVALLKNIREVPEDIRQAVINNGGGHVNHSLFWQMMAPKAGGSPKGDVGQAISKAFGTFEKFQTAMNEAAMKRFGSGWAWLVVGPNRALKIVSTANQDSPFSTGDFPILGVDVWEHAYYLKYQNRRADYLAAWWNVVNWDYVNELYRNSQAG